MCVLPVYLAVRNLALRHQPKCILESAYFNSVSVRKTAKRHGLKTDASFRFERGTDPDMTVFALKRAALLIKEVAGGQISSEISDFYPAPVTPFEVEVTYHNIDRLIGQQIPHEEIKAIIAALDIKIVNETADGLSLKVPPYRVDVTRDVDVIEEILRIYGYNNIYIPTQIRISRSIHPSGLIRTRCKTNWQICLLLMDTFEILSNSLTKSAYSKSNLDTAVKYLTT